MFVLSAAGALAAGLIVLIGGAQACGVGGSDAMDVPSVLVVTAVPPAVLCVLLGVVAMRTRDALEHAPWWAAPAAVGLLAWPVYFTIAVVIVVVAVALDPSMSDVSFGG